MAATPTQITRRQTNFFTATGDLLIGAGGAGTTPTVLPIGSTNQVLTVVSGTPAWSTAAAVPNFSENEVLLGGPSGTGSPGTSYTLAHTPNPLNSLKLYLNGQRLTYTSSGTFAGTSDFTVSGITVTLAVTTVSGDTLVADYRY